MKFSLFLSFALFAQCTALDQPASRLGSPVAPLEETERDLFLFAGKRCPKKLEACLATTPKDGAPLEEWGTLVEAMSATKENDIMKLMSTIISLASGASITDIMMDCVSEVSGQALGDTLGGVQGLLTLTIGILSALATGDLLQLFTLVVQLITGTGSLFPQSFTLLDEFFSTVTDTLTAMIDGMKNVGNVMTDTIDMVSNISSFFMVFLSQVTNALTAGGNTERADCASALSSCEFDHMLVKMVPTLAKLAFATEA